MILPEEGFQTLDVADKVDDSNDSVSLTSMYTR